MTVELPPTPPLTEDEEIGGRKIAKRITTKQSNPPIWWSNGIFFVLMHVIAVLGAFIWSPWWELDARTALMCFVSWQLATYGITMGYHRLWSHRAFTARMPLKVILAGAGCLGFQGSIKCQILSSYPSIFAYKAKADSDDDPYDATKGLMWSHMGWIFYKPIYPRLKLIERRDLDADPVVNFQHKFYIPLTLFLGFVVPTLLGATYGDALGGYIWGGVVARLLIWHFTFCINSLAHYLGDQPYSEDVTARGNLILAIFSATLCLAPTDRVKRCKCTAGGEASHNYHHSFPQDYRNGPHKWDWDPTKHLIWLCHRYTPLAPTVKSTPQSEIDKARARVLKAKAERLSPTSSPEDAMRVPVWNKSEVRKRVAALIEERMACGALKQPLVVLIDGFACEVSAYAAKHPGGVAVLRSHRITDDEDEPTDATEAFNGGLNNHGSVARDLMLSMRIARIVG